MSADVNPTTPEPDRVERWRLLAAAGDRDARAALALLAETDRLKSELESRTREAEQIRQSYLLVKTDRDRWVSLYDAKP